MFGPHAPRPASPLAPVPRIAIAMTVRNEDMRRVLPALRRLLHGRTGICVGE